MGLALAPACESDVETGGTGAGAGDGTGECVDQCQATPCCDGMQCWRDSSPQCGRCDTTQYVCRDGEWESTESGCRPPCECEFGETRPCTCPDGSTSVEECQYYVIDAEWGPCQCGGAGGAAGSPSSGGAGGQ
ncbi:MAG: hypothetical protein JRI23_03690 [Deltaproteobacteria bacterium]|nr:hypothetical protein [Deltaproteobacteria bacterium]MBW2530621.1 hypothetical protein [Deltaproteobacteria bacterium]